MNKRLFSHLSSQVWLQTYSGMQRSHFFFVADSQWLFNAREFLWQRHLSSPRIQQSYYHIAGDISYVSRIECRLSFIKRDSTLSSRMIAPTFWPFKCQGNKRNPTLWFGRNWIRQRMGEALQCYNEHARRGVRQTNSERKGRLNVLGMWQTVGEGTLTPVRMLLGRFQVSHPPPPFHTRMSSLPEGNQVGSHIRGKDGKESASAGCLVKTGLLYGEVLASGRGHEAWPERGPHGHKLWGQNLNITSINAWPKYCVCEAEFSISSPDLNWHLGPLFTLVMTDFSTC